MKTEKQKSKWGFGIAGLVISFVIFILSMVMYASLQDYQLVKVDYYESSINYQNKIDSRKRSQALEYGLEIKHQLGESQILFSLDQARASKVTGQIKMIRPSNARLDLVWPISLDESGQQVLSTSEMVSGQWRIEVEWSLDSVDYYDETKIIVP